MRFVKIEPRAVVSLREKLRITQQELAARVGCSLSAVQFWEAGRSSPRGYRLRRLLELCPDEETRALFAAPAETPPADVPHQKAKLPGQAELERRYLDPAFLRSLPPETRALYKATVENILHLSALKISGNRVAAEGLHLLAETIIQMAGMATEPSAVRGRRGKLPPESSREPRDPAK
jgi:transcriptional regulator with XRE-family HTH domain